MQIYDIVLFDFNTNTHCQVRKHIKIHDTSIAGGNGVLYIFNDLISVIVGVGLPIEFLKHI